MSDTAFYVPSDPSVQAIVLQGYRYLRIRPDGNHWLREFLAPRTR